MASRSPIQDSDHKLDILEHVNQDHSEEVLAIAESHLNGSFKIVSAKIVDLFEEGVLIQASTLDEKTSESNTSDNHQDVFAPFVINGSLEDKILYLAYAAIVKQGRDFSGTGKRFFEVINTQNITRNITRLTLQSSTPLPDYYPGHAFAFVLKSLQKRPEFVASPQNKKSWQKNLFDRVFIWLMKHLSNKQRQKLLMSANKDVRLYTLRKAWQSEASDFIDQAHVDIFTHDNTLGSQWANSLNKGDIISSRSEAKDKHPHLHQGQALLIADETAYPALAGILEQWQNPIAPYIILLSEKESEQAYFSHTDLPNDAQIERIVCAPQQQGKKVLTVLEKITEIDAVWGAFESDSAKQVRHFLRNERKVMGRNNHTKAYWRLNTKR
ncbi:siderophore-interacting protein [Marinomonas posidonica]|uniref:Siderophore-interacting protein n=1 Tax=Marinomonas posidonica (strain CECT 7376 / NCIMB 14433 / IVIA-Po-181) TaxID=491952 RepID=F6CX21_MARPP|nr:siderophore-interacting protein [Marinomonas posidonica]AEF53275.1 Siderophore-interacting protein [Marinomonas posidonica IVIA-Po-181]